jgi:hypothetical protein
VHEACRTAAKTYSVSFPNGIKWAIVMVILVVSV